MIAAAAGLKTGIHDSAPHPVKEKIKELRRDSAAGSDGITPKMLKELGASVLEPLEILFNQSFQSGEVPCE
jgi:hypothetical protein